MSPLAGYRHLSELRLPYLSEGDSDQPCRLVRGEGSNCGYTCDSARPSAGTRRLSSVTSQLL